MAIPLAFLFLVVIDIAVHSGEAVPKHVHKMMTKREIAETFGSEEVPEYEIIEVTMPGARRRRDTDEGFEMKAMIKGTETTFNFKPVTPYLATKYTPVWIANSDNKAFNGIRYDPMENAMTDVGDFKMYQDPEHQAAVVVFSDADDGPIIEGILTRHYSIKSLPKRLIGETIKVGDGYMMETPPYQNRSVHNPNQYEEIGHYIVFRSTPMPEGADFAPVLKRDRRQAPYGDPEFYRDKMPEDVYPEVLLVVEHNAMRTRTLTQVLRFMIAFWNGVDLIYSPLKSPRVHITFAGIIVSGDDRATPYIESNTNKDISGHTQFHLRDMSEYFMKEGTRFPFRTYDMIIAMTRLMLCYGVTEYCQPLLGIADLAGACELQFPGATVGSGMKAGAIVYYNFGYGGIRTAAHEAAHLFGVEHDDSKLGCSSKGGYNMAPSSKYEQKGMEWSHCSLMFFKEYFAQWASDCLDNEPPWLKPVSEVLPGRWMSLNGQCRNAGHYKWCKVPKIPICMVKGCRERNSTDCQISDIAPLPGSACGKDMFCSGPSCVPNE